MSKIETGGPALSNTISDLTMRDHIALSATADDIDRHRGWFQNPQGGCILLARYTVEQARYRYADAMLAARNAGGTHAG